MQQTNKSYMKLIIAPEATFYGSVEGRKSKNPTTRWSDIIRLK